MRSDSVPRREDGDHAALLAVLAYASYQRELQYPSDLGHTPKPAVRLQLEAEAMAMDPNRCHDLGHAQALAVLALLEMSSGSLEKAWELLGEATSTVSALGLVVKLNDADRISQPVPMRHERVSDATGLIPGLRTLYRRRRSAAVPGDMLFAAGSSG
ncbi:hypothetical protein CEP52_009500 [Fusarium oligoseptatum]|uniref:Uncharacterized protein n=1 Tax=Fusarium oligoseptatum TaxID=2604345 RepID=A0A428TCV9_9HYPO|nr:hypothetical protein CEP52_009500 [Fusarium oligoseptatum]